MNKRKEKKLKENNRERTAITMKIFSSNKINAVNEQIKSET